MTQYCQATLCTVVCLIASALGIHSVDSESVAKRVLLLFYGLDNIVFLASRAFARNYVLVYALFSHRFVGIASLADLFQALVTNVGLCPC
jgi:hypothetical protein